MAIDRAMALRAARKMIDRYHSEALAEVDLRIAELSDRGQYEAEGLWKEIREAVMLLINKSDDVTEH